MGTMGIAILNRFSTVGTGVFYQRCATFLAKIIAIRIFRRALGANQHSFGKMGLKPHPLGQL
jgi:hypothetical protein